MSSRNIVCVGIVLISFLSENHQALAMLKKSPANEDLHATYLSSRSNQSTSSMSSQSTTACTSSAFSSTKKDTDTKKANVDDASKLVALGQWCMNPQNRKKNEKLGKLGIAYFQQAAAMWWDLNYQDVAYARYCLGVAYEQGQLVEKDIKRAVKYFELAARYNPFACCKYANYCRLGKDIACDKKKAARHYKRAVKLAKEKKIYCEEALIGFADCLIDGIGGIGVDATQARALLQKAANHFSIPARIRLAYLYEYLVGFDRENSVAVKLAKDMAAYWYDDVAAFRGDEYVEEMKKLFEADGYALAWKTCPLCANQTFKVRDSGVITKCCQHMFHEQCLQAWIAQNGKLQCPHCKLFIHDFWCKGYDSRS